MLTLQDPQLPHLVLRQYGLTAYTIDLLNDVRHITYHVQTVDDRHFHLRICLAASPTRHLLDDELLWLDFVACHHQVQVPVPVRNRAGTFVTPVEQQPYLACLFTWMDGQPATLSVTPEALHELGRAIALLHSIARSFPLPTTRPFRPDFYYDARLVSAHRTWSTIPHAARNSDQSATLDAAIAFVLNAFTLLDTDSTHFGLIHADIHLGNVILNGSQVAIIDFEQLGWGYYGYDLAVLYTELAKTPTTVPQTWPHVLTGYQTIAPLPFNTSDDFAAFVAAVHLAFLDWVYNAQHPAVWQEQSARIPTVYAALDAMLKHAGA